MFDILSDNSPLTSSTRAGQTEDEPLNASTTGAALPSLNHFSDSATASATEKAGQTLAVTALSTTSDTSSVPLISNMTNGCPGAEKSIVEDVAWDCDNLPPMKLRAKYVKEATCHRNMLGRQKSKAAVIHPDFKTFPSFLRIVGAMPAKNASLDRIDNNDPEYAPGKVRWADKVTQNNNKSDSLVFHNPSTGAYFTAKQLAEKQGVSADTIRKRRVRGWTDPEIIAGKKAAKVTLFASSNFQSTAPSAMQPGPISPRKAGEASWTTEMARARDNGDYARMEELRSWKAQYDALSAHHREFRLLQPDAFEDLPPLCDQENERLIAIYGYDILTEEQWLERFKVEWFRHRPHVFFERCSPAHRAMIEKVDPEYVRRHREHLAMKSKLAEQL